MITPSYNFSHGLCLNSLLQVWLIGNQRDHINPLIYINRSDEVSQFFIRRKVLGDMKYLMNSVKPALEAVVIWTEESWDMKRVN